MCNLIDCIICGRSNVKAKSFLIKQEVQEGVFYEKEITINKKICETCYKPESLGGLLKGGNGQWDRYSVYIELYAKDFEDEFWSKSKIKRDEILNCKQIADALVEKGRINTIMDPDSPNYKKIGKAWVREKYPNMLFNMKVPSGKNLRLQDTNFVLKKDFEEVLKLPQDRIDGVTQIKYMGNGKHKLSKERLDELHKEGWVRFANKGEARFGNHLIEKQRVCITCGLVKNWADFRDTGGHFNVWTCLDCERARAKKYYVENREDCLARAKTPEAKKRKRELEKTPKYKYARSIRSRLKKYVETALKGSNPTFLNKKTGITNRELVELVEDLSEDWMNHNNHYVENHEGAWHIDHVIPLCLWETHCHVNPFYDESVPVEERIGPNHWSNLRPLCAKENMCRNNRDLDYEDVKNHYDRIRALYPDRNVGQINLEPPRPKEKESNQLVLDFV